MIVRHFEAMGTTWALVADRGAEVLGEAESLVRAMEARLSRFEVGSALSILNRTRRCDDAMLAEVVRVALAWRDRTRGALDPTMGRTLGALGYDVSFGAVGGRVCAPSDARPAVVVDGDAVRLDGDGALDLGGIAKGWAVDRVAQLLHSRGVERALVDGGGDLRAVGGPWPVGVADEDAIVLDGDAVATSSTRRRAWRAADGRSLHHVIDPATGLPCVSSVDTATVRAADATTADALATAVLVDPGGMLPRLHLFGAAAMVRDTSGTWWTTPEWEVAA